MRNRFVKTLCDEARTNKSINLITGDLGFGVLDKFWNEFPNQFVNAGISEQNMTGVAAGMAKEGKIVFTYSIANFPTMRCLEQVRNDCAYHNANVKIVCVGGGMVYGPHGMSHHATEDFAIMRALPNVIVTAPGDLIEAECVTKAIIKEKGTCYMRLGRGGEKQIHEKIDNFELGKAIKVVDGRDVAIFSTGAILDEAVKTCEELKNRGISAALYSFPTIKPIDKAVIEMCAEKFPLIVTMEEHNIYGGFGSAVSEVLALAPRNASLLPIALNDTYTSVVGKHDYLRQVYGLDYLSMAEKIEHKLT